MGFEDGPSRHDPARPLGRGPTICHAAGKKRQISPARLGRAESTQEPDESSSWTRYWPIRRTVISLPAYVWGCGCCEPVRWRIWAERPWRTRLPQRQPWGPLHELCPSGRTGCERPASRALQPLHGTTVFPPGYLPREPLEEHQDRWTGAASLGRVACSQRGGRVGYEHRPDETGYM